MKSGGGAGGGRVWTMEAGGAAGYLTTPLGAVTVTHYRLTESEKKKNHRKN